MHKHKEAQAGRIVLDIGGYRYTTLVQTLRRLPHTFFDAYFSGRYAMDRCEDGSIFIDRDGEHFGQVLEYLRDGVLSVAEQDEAELDVSVLRWLKREMGFYCIEVMAEPQEVAFAVGGLDNDGERMASMEQYDIASGVWREVAPMRKARSEMGLCEVNGELYVTGGEETGDAVLASVERYNPSLDTWSFAPAMSRPRYGHCAYAVGYTMFVLGGVMHVEGGKLTVSSVLKFDSRARTWSEVEPMPAERDCADACVVGSDIYIFGGRDDDEKVASTTYPYGTETNTWAALAPMPDAKFRHSVCMLDGLIYVMGGEQCYDFCLDSVHRFDPVANSWHQCLPCGVHSESLF
jgi:hypothetical protein